jgi:exodeoxyribonuclease III
MKITTWNVNGIRARETQVSEWLNTQAPDLLCLQEIKASPSDVPAALCSVEGYWCYWHGHKGYSGVALHVRKGVAVAQPSFVHPSFDHENRIVTAQVGQVVVASVYVPNGGKDFPAKVRFLDALEAWVQEIHQSGRLLVLCGDLNVARLEVDVHPKLRKPEQLGQTPAERAQFERILGHGLVDLSRQFEPDNDQLFTWWAPWRQMRERNIGWRLDYVLCSEALARTAKSCSAEREFGTSDHGPVTAVFEAHDAWKSGPGPVQEGPAGPAPEPKAKGQLTFEL